MAKVVVIEACVTFEINPVSSVLYDDVTIFLRTAYDGIAIYIYQPDNTSERIRCHVLGDVIFLKRHRARSVNCASKRGGISEKITLRQFVIFNFHLTRSPDCASLMNSSIVFEDVPFNDGLVITPNAAAISSRISTYGAILDGNRGRQSIDAAAGTTRLICDYLTTLDSD